MRKKVFPLYFGLSLTALPRLYKNLAYAPNVAVHFHFEFSINITELFEAVLVKSIRAASDCKHSCFLSNNPVSLSFPTGDSRGEVVIPYWLSRGRAKRAIGAEFQVRHLLNFYTSNV